MSLVNDMLRDLDRRKAVEQPTRRPDGSGLSVAPAPVVRNRQRTWLFWFIVAAGILLVINFAIKVFEEYQVRLERDSQTREQAEAVLEPSAEMLSNPVEVDSKVAITRVEISEIETGARIELVLSKPVEHRIVAIDTREIRIELLRAQLTDVLPGLTNNWLIQSIDVAKEAESLQLSVGLTNDSTFQSYLITRPGQPSLIVDLVSKVAVDKTAEQSTIERVDQKIGQETADANQVLNDSTKTGLPEVSPDMSLDASDKASIFTKTSRELSTAELDAQMNRQALKMIRAGKVSEAVSQLQTFIRDMPQALASRETLAGMLLSQGQLESAAILLDQGLARVPDHLAFVKLQARVLMASDQYGDALAVLENRYQGPQDNMLEDWEFLSLLAPLYQRQERHIESVRVFRKLLDLNPEQAQWWIGQAISLEALGMREDALAAYLRSTRIPSIDARLKKYADARIGLLK